MDPLRWRYRIQVSVEETAYRMKEEGFVVIFLEGQSRTFGEPYPLNQIDIKSEIFGSNVKVKVGPNVTQVYFALNDEPTIDDLEEIVANLEKVENILNQNVKFSDNETSRYNEKTRKPVMSVTMLKMKKMLSDGFDDIIQAMSQLYFKEFSRSLMLLAQGKIVPSDDLHCMFNEMVKTQRGLIQIFKEQGNDQLEKYERELDETVSYTNRFTDEIRSAKSQREINEIIKKYSDIEEQEAKKVKPAVELEKIIKKYSKKFSDSA